MYAQYDLTTKEVVGYHERKRDSEGEYLTLDPIPENLVVVPSIYEEEVRIYHRVITVDDADPQNKTLVVPADIISEAAMYDLIEARTEEGREIVKYLEDYLNDLATKYGYMDYHAAMVFKDSTISTFQAQGAAMYACTEAIWAYFEAEKDNFMLTGHPNLAEVKANHPKFETFKTW